MKHILTYILLCGSLTLFAGGKDKPAYRIFNKEGKATSYEAMLKSALDHDLILFGEIHNNPVCHWLQYELATDIQKSASKRLVLGAEMFETDNQLLVNEYTSGLIRKKDFDSEAKLWPNYKTDYAPLLDFARKNKLKFVASNVPRRYAALVNLKGFEGLDSINAFQRALIAPLPIKYPDTLECYSSIGKAVGEGMPAHMTANLGKAQALKDATMAHFILKNGIENETIFLHFNGAYHSDNFQGIVWYVNHYISRTAYTLKVMTISTVTQEEIDDLSEENKGKADFILCIPESFTPGE